MNQQTQPATADLVSASDTAVSAGDSTDLPKDWDLKPRYIGSSSARIRSVLATHGKVPVLFIDEIYALEQAKR